MSTFKSRINPLPAFRSFFLSFGLFTLATLLAGGCASNAPSVLPASDPELYRLANAAQQTFRQTGPERAIPLFRAALQRARSLDLPDAIRPLAFNLAACLMENGAPNEASALLREALQEAKRAGGPTAEILTLSARSAFQTGRVSEARELYEAAARAARKEHRRDVQQMLALFAVELALEEKDLPAVRSLFARANRATFAGEPLPLQAHREGVRARLLLREGETRAAAKAWERQASLLGRAGLARSVPRTLRRAARAYATAEAHPAAAACEYRAARSYLAQNRRQEGLEALNQARVHARNPSVGKSLRDRIEALATEPDEPGPPPAGKAGTD